MITNKEIESLGFIMDNESKLMEASDQEWLGSFNLIKEGHEDVSFSLSRNKDCFGLSMNKKGKNFSVFSPTVFYNIDELRLMIDRNVRFKECF